MKPHEAWWQANLPDREAEFRRWLEESDPSSRVALAGLITREGPASILECGPGAYLDWELFHSHTVSPARRYEVLDVTPAIVDRGRELGIPATLGSIEAIPFADSAFELTYCRAVVEHLPGYREAIRELYRVTSRLAVVIFWRIEDRPDDLIRLDEDRNAPGTYQNVYSRARVEATLLELGITRYEWIAAGYPLLVMHK